MSDYLNEDVDAYTNDINAVVQTQADQAGPFVTTIAAKPSALGDVSTRSDGAFGRLGDFAPRSDGACSVNALAKLLWRFYSQIAAGLPIDALGTLNLFRSLYGHKLEAIRGGFDARLAAGLPATLPDTAWTPDMRSAAELVLIGALGQTNAAAATGLASMPRVMSDLGAWWNTFRSSAALNDADRTALRGYIDVPLPTGVDPNAIIASYVNDDLGACRAGAPAPAPPAVVFTPAGGGASPATASQTIRCWDGSVVPVGVPCPPQPGAPGGSGGGGGALVATGGGSGGGGQPSSGPSATVVLGGLAIAGLVAYGLWKASQDKPGEPALGAAAGLGDVPPELRAKAEAAAKRDARVPGRTCVPSANLRRSVSMDEWGGPAGEKLAEELFKMPVAQANEAETVYFHALRAQIREKNPNTPECEG